MRPPVLFILFISLSIFTQSHCQNKPGNTSFFIGANILGKDSGSVILWYSDDSNKIQADTAWVKNGRFSFSGTTNRVCEALLWADPDKKEFDNVSMIRFLLEPGRITIEGEKDREAKALIKGSQSQIEKQRWDNLKGTRLATINSYRKAIDSLYGSNKTIRDDNFKHQVSDWSHKIDSVNRIITQMDVQYVREHTNSFLSAYLLSKQVRKLPVDTIQYLYSGLSPEVKNSAVAHDVLVYVYPKTDDIEFRRKYPLVSNEFDERLRNIHSVKDLSLYDVAGNKVDFSSFQSKYFVIDFWTSSCSPCIANIPAWNKLTQKYNPGEIQFISVCLDKDAADWKKAINKYQFISTHLSDLQGFNGLAAVYCKVLWVPAYIIADSKGNIINYNAPHPNDPEFTKLLDNLLKQSL